MNRLKIARVNRDRPGAEAGALLLDYFGVDVSPDLDGVNIVDVRCARPSADSDLSFDELLPSIAATLIDANQQLAVFVKGAGRDFYDEADAMTRFLHPRRRRYHLSTPLIWRQDDIGDLIFGCDPQELKFINDEWLVSPAVTLEGYVGSRDIVDRLVAMRAGRGDATLDAVRILRTVDFAFRLWQDYDGMSVFSLPGRAEQIYETLIGFPS